MKYLVCILFPLLLQVLVTFAIIQATKGGGSFVGLGAMLAAVLGIPATALVNIVFIRMKPDLPGLAHFSRSFLVALVLPALQAALAIAVSVFRL